jgi:hypothetical protein
MLLLLALLALGMAQCAPFQAAPAVPAAGNVFFAPALNVLNVTLGNVTAATTVLWYVSG